MDPNNVVGTPSAQPQPAPTAAATISAELAAAPEPAKPENPMVAAQPEKKSSKGGIIAAVLFALVATGGVGFGVWTMMDGNAQKDALNDQISTLKQQNVELMDKIAEGGGGEDEDKSDYSGGPYIENGYFYVPEWKLKFQIPSELANYGYSVDYDSAHVGYTLPSIGFTAMLASDVKDRAQVAYYDDIDTCTIVTVTKEDGVWPEGQRINGMIKQFDNYALLIWNYSRHQSCDFNLHIDEVQEKIQMMFSNPEAY